MKVKLSLEAVQFTRRNIGEIEEFVQDAGVKNVTYRVARSVTTIAQLDLTFSNDHTITVKENEYVVKMNRKNKEPEIIILPQCVIDNPRLLQTNPLYQQK